MAPKPYRVVYAYPGQKPVRAAHIHLWKAEQEAGMIGARGADVTLLRLDGDGEHVVARFGPDVRHRWRQVRGQHAVCECGRAAPMGSPIVDETGYHMDAAGVCRVCDGSTQVPQRATRYDEQVPTPGNLIECPVCQGSGQAADVSYWQVDTGTFYTRLQALRLAAGLPANAVVSPS